MAILRGGDTIFAARFKDELGESTTMRVLYQTDGSHSITADEIEINTKDVDGVDYGSVTEEIGFEGYVGNDDPALERIKEDLRGKKFIEILKIDINTLVAEVGKYMVSNLDYGYPDKESTTYSFSAKLTGRISTETLTDIPEGANEI